jgi:hypothetical protein
MSFFLSKCCTGPKYLARWHVAIPEKKVRITQRASFIPVFTQVRTASTDPLTHRPQAAATGSTPAGGRTPPPGTSAGRAPLNYPK